MKKMILSIMIATCTLHAFSQEDADSQAEQKVVTAEEREAILSKYVRMKTMLATGKAYEANLRMKIDKQQIVQAELHKEVFSKTKIRASQRKIDEMEKELAIVIQRIIAMEVYLKEFERVNGLNRPPVTVRR